MNARLILSLGLALFAGGYAQASGEAREELGDVSARLQRVRDFPSQLRDYTLYQIKGMLDRGDFSIASQAQLKLAKKLLENPDRLMEKAQ